MINEKIKSDMLIFLGLLEAINFPLNNSEFNQAYYDLIEMMTNRYKYILEQLIDYKNE